MSLGVHSVSLIELYVIPNFMFKYKSITYKHVYCSEDRINFIGQLVMVRFIFLFICRMVMDMLTLYLHYEDENQEVKILQRSMMRRHVSYYDLLLMTEEVGFRAIDFLYYAKKDPKCNSHFVPIDDPSIVIKMLSDLEMEKAVHLYVSKEPAPADDISPSTHPNDSILQQDGGVSSEGAEQPIMRRPESISLFNLNYSLDMLIYSSYYWNNVSTGCFAGKLRRSRRLNVIQIDDQHNDEDGDLNNDIPPGDESQALEDEEDQSHNQGDLLNLNLSKVT